jgi:D-xylose transport system permease protein
MGEGAAIAIAIGAGVVFTFIIALIIGLFDGFMIGRFAIPSFVITLGILSAARGGSLLLSNATGLSDRTNAFKNFASWYIPIWPSAVLLAAALVLILWSTWKDVQRRKQYNLAIDRAEVGSKIVLGLLGIAAASYVFLGHKGIPVFVAILCVIVFSASFVLRHLPLGRRLYALGGNEQAARLSGIDVFKLRMFVFTLMTLLSCVAGLLNAARSGGVSPGVTGVMAELDAIAAVVIGGTSLMGGIGTVEGSIVGSFIIGAIRNGMTLLGVDANWEYVVRGFIVILAVWFDIAAKKRN